MIVTIIKAKSRTNDYGYKLAQEYILLLRQATTGQISIANAVNSNSEIIYEHVHGFLKDWRNILPLGYANNEADLIQLFKEVTGVPDAVKEN